MNDKILNNPRIQEEEALIRAQSGAVRKKKWWIFKLILILILLLVGFCIFLYPEKIQDFVNNFFENLLK